MNVNLLYPPEKVGQREILVGNGAGPQSYNQAAGDVLVLPPGLYIDLVFGKIMTPDKTYFCRAYPSAIGMRATWILKWYTSSNGNEVGNGTNLSAESVQFGMIGGEF